MRIIILVVFLLIYRYFYAQIPKDTLFCNEITFLIEDEFLYLKDTNKNKFYRVDTTYKYLGSYVFEFKDDNENYRIYLKKLNIDNYLLRIREINLRRETITVCKSKKGE